MPPDESRNEGTPSPGEVPNAGAQRFWLLFWRLKKVTRRKGETLRSRYRSNGYSHKAIKPHQPQRESHHAAKTPDHNQSTAQTDHN
jgi:hypothetical protein